MKKKRLFTELIGISIILMLTGCGGASQDNSTEACVAVGNSSSMYEVMDMEYAEEAVAEYDTGFITGSNGMEPGQGVDESAVATDRKLIRTVDMSVETKEFDTLLASVEQQVKTLGGYIESMNQYNGHSYNNYRRDARNADMVIRVPQSKLEEFLNTLSGISNVVNRSETVKDITLTYVDLDSHKKALLAEQDRLLQLMEQAETIEDLITIESRLSDLRYQIQSMESQLRTYDNKVDYSTINLYIDEVEMLTPVREETTWERISTGFIDNLKAIKDGFVEFVIWFTVSIPYLLIWAVIIVAVVLGVKRFIKRDKKKQEQMTASKGETNDTEGKNTP